MEHNQVLALTHKEDGTADLVINKILEKGGRCVRFNTEDYPEKVKITMFLDGSKFDGCIKFNNDTLNFKDIATVWYRRPHNPSVTSISDSVAKNWVEEESLYALRCLWTLLEDKFWVNSLLSCEKIQFNKWHQMIIANKVGLSTPLSILANCHKDIVRLCRNVKGDLALKVIKNVAVNYDNKTLLLHTKRVSQVEIEKTSPKAFEFSPIFLQKYIDKKLELRITVIRDKVFACEIHSQDNEKTLEDWRKHVFLKDELPHNPCELPAEIESMCVLLVRKLGLYFGAIDMILTPDDKYVFLEVNPNGQWGWIEELTKMPISSAMADLLMSKQKCPVS
ncbi:MAG: hypothetical protein L6Q29_04380 [Candidatus Pacebacteria bacterium]|nr:hypothetical protein [Candidatus Paceibacterota bacterium]NUQ57588.1 hypothetical protein [Candidatus Paceibacter sp.]